MATQAQVVALKNQGKSVKEIAERLGIQASGVYGHLRRAEEKGAALAVEPFAELDHDTPMPSNGGASASVTLPTSLPNPLAGEHPLVSKIRQEIGDVIEHVESEMNIKRQEIVALERQHKQLYTMLTTPLPDPAEK